MNSPPGVDISSVSIDIWYRIRNFIDETIKMSINLMRIKNASTVGCHCIPKTLNELFNLLRKYVYVYSMIMGFILDRKGYIKLQITDFQIYYYKEFKVGWIRMKRITSQESFRYILKNDGIHEEKFAICSTASLAVIFFFCNSFVDAN